MDTWRTLCVYLVRIADNSSSYPVDPQMLNDLTYPKTRSIFFSALVQHCWLCEHIFICHMGSRWRGWRMGLLPVDGSVFSICWVRGLRRFWSSPATFKHEAVPVLHVMWTWMRHGVSRGRTRTIYHSKFIKWPSHSEEKDQRKDNINGVFKRLI